jgi:hypothetical protein
VTGDSVCAEVAIGFEPSSVVVGAEPIDGRALPEQPEAVMTNSKPTMVRSRLARTFTSSPPSKKLAVSVSPATKGSKLRRTHDAPAASLGP